LAASSAEKNTDNPRKDGDDVPLYLEKQLDKLLTELEVLKEEDENS
jgi:hypothetical protein